MNWTTPQDVAAEQAVLGAMLLSRDARDEVAAMIAGPDFYRPTHEHIYDAITTLHDAREPVDAVTVADALARRGQLAPIEGGPLYLADLIASAGVTANAAHHAAIIRDKAILRRVLDSTIAIQQAATTEGATGETVADDARQRFAAVEHARSTTSTFADLEEKLLADLDTGAASGIPTPWPEVDAMIRGLRAGELVVVGARPGVGKTLVGQALARGVASSGRPVLFASLEMTAEDLHLRAIASRARFPLTRLLEGRLSEREWSAIGEHVNALRFEPVHVDDSGSQTVGTVRASARRLARAGDLGLIVVDYLQLMSSGRRVESRQVEVAEFSRQLKLLAKELRVPVVALSQLNRDSTRGNRKPTLADLRESGAIEQDADVVLLLHAEDGAPDLSVIVAKNRRGPMGECQLIRQGAFARVVSQRWAAA